MCGSLSYAQDVDRALNGLSDYWKKVDTLTCDFVQKKRLALLSGEVVSSGTFAYKNPGLMVFRYAPPEDTIMGIRPGLVTIYFPSLKKAKRIHLSGAAEVPREMSFGMGPIGDTKALKEAFSVAVSEKNGTIEMTFVPKGKNDAIAKVVIVFRKDYTPLYTTIVEPRGDTTTLEFTHQKINTPVNDSLFEVTIPRGVQVEDIGG